MLRTHSAFALAAAIAVCAFRSEAQETAFSPASSGSWRSQDLYLGRAFTRQTEDSIWIWLGQYSSALWTNRLEVFGSDGKPVFLFDNFASPESLINLSAVVDIKVGDTLWFRCTVVEGGGGVNRRPKYSGPNWPGSAYYSGAAQPPTAPAGVAGRRWSVAGRIDRDFVEFGFEDVADSNSNFSFDDLVARLYLPEARTAPGLPGPGLYPKTPVGEYADHFALFPPIGTTVRYSLDGTDPASGTLYVPGTQVPTLLDPFRLRAVAIGPGGAKGPETQWDFNGYGISAVDPPRRQGRERIRTLLRERGYDARGRSLRAGAKVTTPALKQ